MSPNIQLLLAFMDEAFDRRGWHGPTLREALRGVTAAEADRRPGECHTIREVTVHAAYWKHIVHQRLTGDKQQRFPMDGANWFGGGHERDWKSDVQLLLDEHRKLRAVVAAYPPRLLDKSVASRQTAAFNIRGVVAHDLYHAGQIQMIKKMQRRSGAA